jgi:hypothetical protein
MPKMISATIIISSQGVGKVAVDQHKANQGNYTFGAHLTTFFLFQKMLLEYTSLQSKA